MFGAGNGYIIRRFVDDDCSRPEFVCDLCNSSAVVTSGRRYLTGWLELMTACNWARTELLYSLFWLGTATVAFFRAPPSAMA